jgi:hypothetical protein
MSRAIAVLVLLTTACGDVDATRSEAEPAVEGSAPDLSDESTDSDDVLDTGEPDTHDDWTTTGAIPLFLETRSGTSSTGWSFSANDVVDAANAHLVLSSWDCGARGRWVRLEGQGIEFCHATEDGALDPDTCGRTTLEVGGSQPELALGERFYVRTDRQELLLELVDRTETPFEWYEAEDLSFFVDLDVVDGE